MRYSGMGMARWFAGFGAGLTASAVALAAAAEDRLGQPTPGAIDLQPAASPLKHDAIFFHNQVLLPIITAITLLVLGLLLWVMFRYNKRANPTPSKFSHNTLIEIIWTAAPVLILMFIAIFSFKLLFAYHDMPKPDLTVKATGYQWYWTYDYPDQKIEGLESRMLDEADARAAGKPYRLGADEPLVVPVNRVVRVQVTGYDVIHAFALPAFGLKTDAIPGRLNESWFKAEKVGTYYGQCSELCGVDHAFMPIEIKVVSDADFAAFVAAKGGSMAGAQVAAGQAAPSQAAPAQASPAQGPAALPPAGPPVTTDATAKAASGATPAPKA